MAKKEGKKVNPPTGIKAISIYYYIMAAFIFFVAIISSSALFIVGVTLISLGLFGAIGLFAWFAFVIGRNLWNGKNWAKIAVIVISILSIISMISTVLNISQTLKNYLALDVISGLIALIILLYLIINKESKSYFIKTRCS